MNIKLKNAQVASVPLNNIYHCIRTAAVIIEPANLQKNDDSMLILYFAKNFSVRKRQLNP